MRCILDTDVLVAGLRSRSGASFQLLTAAGRGAFEHVLTVPLVLEYEDVLTRPGVVPGPSQEAAGVVVDYLCRTGIQVQVHYLWRPQLADPRDDLVLEAAVNGQAPHLVTFNTRDFGGSERFGIRAETPGAFLRLLRQHGRL